MQQRLASTADRLLHRHGGDAELLTEESSGPRDPYDPEPVTEIVYPVRVITWRARVEHMEGSLIQTGDQFAMIQLEDVEPTPADRLKVAGREWQIVAAHRIAPNPDAAPIGWRLHLRGPVG